MNLPNKNLTFAAFAICSLTGNLDAITVDFTTGEGYADGDINGQENWSRVFGPEPLINVDTSGSGSFAQADTGGAVSRTFTDMEVGGVFDNSSSVITYEFVITHNTLTDSPTFNGMAWGIGDSIFTGSQKDLAINFRDDGRIAIEDGVLSGNDTLLGGFSVIPASTPVTVSLTIDWSTSTYTASRSDTGATFTDNPFVKGVGGNGGHYIRIDSTAVMDASFDTFSISAVPEPSSYALIVGTLALGWIVARRRR